MVRTGLRKWGSDAASRFLIRGSIPKQLISSEGEATPSAQNCCGETVLARSMSDLGGLQYEVMYGAVHPVLGLPLVFMVLGRAFDCQLRPQMMFSGQGHPVFQV